MKAKYLQNLKKKLAHQLACLNHCTKEIDDEIRELKEMLQKLDEENNRLRGAVIVNDEAVKDNHVI
jgi:lipid II:glycine glycyltransferase (peptidoglycan interpeptide bridge formation enzyme)